MIKLYGPMGGALVISVACTVFAAIAATNGHALAAVAAQPFAAGGLSLFVVAAARWLEGPLRFGVSKRGEMPHSRAVAAILMWLACFAAVEAAFLVAGATYYILGVREQVAGDPIGRRVEGLNNVQTGEPDPGNHQVGTNLSAGSTPSNGMDQVNANSSSGKGN